MRSLIFFLLTMPGLIAGCTPKDEPSKDEDTGSETSAEETTDSSPESEGTTSESTTGESDTTTETAGDTGGEATGGTTPEASHCEVGDFTLTCDHQTTTVYTGFTGLLPREVHWQVPLGEPPEGGWPGVIVFQGSLFTAELFWIVLDVEIFGFWNQGMLTKTLLDRGFAVITPEAHAGGATAWDTNIPPMSLWWDLSEDNQFMLDIFDNIDAGAFGEVDPGRLYATGISSGGYMSSRMELEYRERFRALAIQSASYATCAGPICSVPELDTGHLPTLFLHGEDDLVVPMSTMEPYYEALLALGVDTEAITQEGVGHAWIDPAPDAITDWFQSY